MTNKGFPAYGCYCDLSEGDELDDCVLNTDHWSSCSYAVTSWTKNGNPRIRRTPNGCKYWIAADKYDGHGDRSTS